MRPSRSFIAVTLALAASVAAVSPGLAQRTHGHGRRRAASASAPPNAGAAFCRSRARDYAFDKHADPGQERLFFDKCMGR